MTIRAIAAGARLAVMSPSSHRQIDWCGPRSTDSLLLRSLQVSHGEQRESRARLSDLNAGINKHAPKSVVAEAEPFLHQRERESMIAVGRDDARAPLLVEDGEPVVTV